MIPYSTSNKNLIFQTFTFVQVSEGHLEAFWKLRRHSTASFCLRHGGTGSCLRFLNGENVFFGALACYLCRFDVDMRFSHLCKRWWASFHRAKIVIPYRTSNKNFIFQIFTFVQVSERHLEAFWEVRRHSATCFCVRHGRTGACLRVIRVRKVCLCWISLV